MQIVGAKCDFPFVPIRCLFGPRKTLAVASWCLQSARGRRPYPDWFWTRPAGCHEACRSSGRKASLSGVASAMMALWQTLHEPFVLLCLALPPRAALCLRWPYSSRCRFQRSSLEAQPTVTSSQTSAPKPSTPVAMAIRSALYWPRLRAALLVNPPNAKQHKALSCWSTTIDRSPVRAKPTERSTPPVLSSPI